MILVGCDVLVVPFAYVVTVLCHIYLPSSQAGAVVVHPLVGAVVVDIACYYLFGSWIDKYVNSKREQKADIKA